MLRVFEVEGWGFEENVRVAPAGLFMVLVGGWDAKTEAGVPCVETARRPELGGVQLYAVS